MEWFECKVKFDKEIEEGKIISTSESYMLEAASYSDAENRVIEEVRPFVGVATQFEVATIRRVKYADIHFSNNEEDSYWFKIKIIDKIFDEEKGTERKIATNELFQASDLPEAIKYAQKYMDTTSRTYELASVNITPLMDVMPLSLEGESRRPLSAEEKLAREAAEQEAQRAELQAGVEA